MYFQLLENAKEVGLRKSILKRAEILLKAGM